MRESRTEEGLVNEFASKWGKYKLTLLVKKNGYCEELIFKPDNLAALGISIRLFMGAMFFPLFYLGGAERHNHYLSVQLWIVLLNAVFEAALLNIACKKNLNDYIQWSASSTKCVLQSNP